jgi:hypothetical protein
VQGCLEFCTYVLGIACKNVVNLQMKVIPLMQKPISLCILCMSNLIVWTYVRVSFVMISIGCTNKPNNQPTNQPKKMMLLNQWLVPKTNV